MIVPRRLAAPALVALLLVACGALLVDDRSGGSSRRLTPPSQVVFPRVTVDVDLARTDAERARGLGGHRPLGEREGMLFIFERPGLHTFWMKGMTFPLDIMWLADDRVVHVEGDVPPPGPDDSDSSRPTYSPKVPARYVLEVNAGFAQKYGIEVGTPVELKGL